MDGNTITITNPVLRGFQPDAGVCVVGDDYYIATSTFEWWPGVMIYHSKNLADWRLVSRPLNRRGQVSLVGDRNSGGIWAPHLSYADGKFWLFITDVKTDQLFKDTLNYLMTCDSIDGEWSDPVFVNASGFDPALFHDDDGRKYVMTMLWDYRPYKPNFNGVAVQEYDGARQELTGPCKKIFTGTSWGVTEGPQVIKKDGWYYLLCAEGGTGYSHASVVCRSRSIWGPYEVSPYTPLISTKYAPESPLQKCGHASFLHTPANEWYITYICARPFHLQRGECVLGRETGLARLEWVDGWPRLYGAGEASAMPEDGNAWNRMTVPPLTVEVPAKTASLQTCLPGQEGIPNRKTGCIDSRTDFEKPELPAEFHSLREPLDGHMSLTKRPGYLRLYGQQSIASLHNQTLVARRWQSWYFTACTVMEFYPVHYNQMAGLTCFYNTENYMYAYVSWDEDLACRILDVLVCGLGETVVELGEKRIPVPEETVRIHLKVKVMGERLQFFYAFDSGDWEPLGGVLPANHLSDDYIKAKSLVFTGSMVGICVQDLYNHKAYADFDYFSYTEEQ